MKKIRVILIEDSSLMRLVTADLLKKESSIELVAIAKDGKEGIEQVLKFQPDVLITDYLMPEYDGLHVVKELMRINPLPIIVLSALEKSTPEIFEVLKAGAYDFIEKPKRGEILHQNERNPLIQSVLDAVSVNVNLDNLISSTTRINTNQHSFDSVNYEIIVIGASTGGPSAVESVLENLPNNLSIPVIVVQHMPEKFLISFANRLDTVTPLKVVLASEGMKIKGGHIYILPAQNLKIEKKSMGNCFQLDENQYSEFNNSSVD